MIQQNIAIKDVGPIEQLSIQCPPEGGVVVLRGRNGSGKSTALKSAESLIKGNGKLSSRDECRSSGRVDGFGGTMVIGAKTTRAGEIEIASLEGRLNIADLVEPPLKDPGAADRQRIKALVSLTGVMPTCKQFADVIGDEMADFIGGAAWAGKDMLDVAVKAKRDLEGTARNKENEASMREGQAKAHEEAASGVDMTGECDEKILRDNHTKVSGKLSVLEDRATAAKDAADNLAKAREKLNKVQSTYSGPTIDYATAIVTGKRADLFRAVNRIDELKKELEAEKASHDQKQVEYDSAKSALTAAEEHTESVAMYEAILDNTITKSPEESEINAVDQAVDDANIAMEQGVLIRNAKAKLIEAQAARKQSNEAATIAGQLRIAATQIDEVLSSAIKTSQLFVRDGRLYTMHETRGETLFHELSEGERWTLAFDIAAPIVGEQGIMILPQGAWESLDPENRQHVAGLAMQYKITVLTAEATSDGLRAELFEGQVG